MEVKDYCRSIDVELYAWKAKMYDMVRKVDRLKSADKEKIAAQVEDLHKQVANMQRIINQLQTECPVEFGSQKKEIEETREGMKKKYEDTMAAVLQF